MQDSLHNDVEQCIWHYAHDSVKMVVYTKVYALMYAVVTDGEHKNVSVNVWIVYQWCTLTTKGHFVIRNGSDPSLKMEHEATRWINHQTT